MPKTLKHSPLLLAEEYAADVKALYSTSCQELFEFLGIIVA
jgi:hypothetical protein